MNPPSPLGATISSAGIAALVTFATVSILRYNTADEKQL